MQSLNRTLRIGIMGGTFDPIHIGHLVAAETARYQFQLDQVIFVPSGNPPHKTNKQIIDARHRLAMTRLATEDNPAFAVSSVELERQGPSYTVDTMAFFQEEYAGAELYFITGADAILEIMTWKDVPRLLSLCWFIAVTRPGYNLDDLHATLTGMPEGCMQKILISEMPGIAISSTEIRERMIKRQPVRYLIPVAVAEYIRQSGIYR